MRQNLPVSGNEYVYPDGLTLVSTTDLKSRITYCNPAFIEVSGYEREELLGQPHNMIRHPDMPAEAFRDLWATIQSGKPWSAMVKNRRKNGDHYWVVANVTPIQSDGHVSGYMSVRTKPTREQVQAAEALYARMRGEAETGRLRQLVMGGRLERSGALAALRRRLRLSLTGRMVTAMTITAGLSLVAGRLLEDLGPAGAWAGGAAVGATLVGVMGWWLHRTVTTPVRESVDLANQMAAGDLTRSITSDRTDDIGAMLRGLNQLCVNLQAMVFDVRSQSTQVDRAANEISSASHDLSGRTEAQASSLQETAAAIEQIAATVQQNAGSANEANRKAGRAGEVAEDASRAVSEMDSSMQGIAKSSERIAAINGVIDGIAFQTNILALNAAVEAARAGEQGRGFAVVANEVRSLAQRSAAAAQEIKQLIEESRSAVSAGSRLVRSAAETMQGVVASSREVSQLVDGISAASAEQSAGVVQVNTAVAQLDTATQQNAAMVEQSTAAATRLKEQATSLLQSVQIFRLRHG
ncbi:methyl-accepting chemotaxis protein [Ramlibacter sp. MAHUQ-53]|uniref:methyl-accepting chemotaxis protein n=1 Tax=unclassified Ramlibacter TaxID=2617605 RepID=UPI0036457A79